MKKYIIFLNGRMIKANTQLIDALAPGVVKGEGVFETMLVHNGAIFTLTEHLNRLARGLRLLNLPLSYSKRKLEQYLYQTLQANQFKEARIRLAIWREGRGLKTAIVCQEWTGYSARKYKQGIKAIVAAVPRKKTRWSHIKSMDYACFREAFQEAKAKKCEEAILLNQEKQIVEGSRTNIFYINKGVLYTPAVDCGCLNGITRQQVIRHARKMKVPVRVVAVGIKHLLTAQEAFVTNSVIGLMPLTAVEGKQIGSGRAGVLTKKLRDAYQRSLHFSCSGINESV